MDSGDGCTTHWMSLMLLNYALKMVKIVSFMYIFWYNKNFNFKIINIIV